MYTNSIYMYCTNIHVVKVYGISTADKLSKLTRLRTHRAFLVSHIDGVLGNVDLREGPAIAKVI